MPLDNDLADRCIDAYSVFPPLLTNEWSLSKSSGGTPLWVVLPAVHRRILGPTYPYIESHTPAPHPASRVRVLHRPARVLRCLALLCRGRWRSALVYVTRVSSNSFTVPCWCRDDTTSIRIGVGRRKGRLCGFRHPRSDQGHDVTDNL